MTTINPAMSNVGIDASTLASMDIETALMMVQGQRVSLLDAQLKDQIEEVNKRNQLTAQLNDMQGKLNALKAAFKSDAKPGDKVGDTSENKKLARDFAETALNLGVSTDPVAVTNVQRNADGSLKSFELASNWRPTKEGVEKAVVQIKSQLDTASNSQQMDMLRLQSMSNKRNEAFDVMTNFIKKMQDSRSSIVGNMR